MEYEVFTKEPYESFDVAIDFASALKAGSAIGSITSCTSTKVSDGTSVTGILGTPTFSIGGTIVTVRVSAGSDGDRIKITFKITSNDTSPESLESGLIMEVREI